MPIRSPLSQRVSPSANSTSPLHGGPLPRPRIPTEPISPGSASGAGNQVRVDQLTVARLRHGSAGNARAGAGHHVAATSSSRSARLAGQRRTDRHIPGGGATRRGGQDAPLHGGPSPPSHSPPSHDRRATELIRPEPDCRHRGGAQADRPGVPTLRHGDRSRAIRAAEIHIEDVYPRELATRGTLDLDDPVLCAQGAAVSRGWRYGVRALRRWLHRAGRRGTRGGQADRKRSGAA